MALVQRGATIIMGLPDGATVPMLCGGLSTQAEVDGFVEAFDKTQYFHSKYWSNLYEEENYTNQDFDKFVLPVVVADLDKKKDVEITIKLKNQEGQNLFLRHEIPVARVLIGTEKIGSPAKVEDYVESFVGQDLGTDFGLVVSASHSISNVKKG